MEGGRNAEEAISSRTDHPTSTEAEVELAKGQTTGGVCRKLGITEQTYYRWRKEYGSLRVDQVRRLKELERENGRLKKLVADQALDLAILKETSSGNF